VLLERTSNNGEILPPPVETDVMDSPAVHDDLVIGSSDGEAVAGRKSDSVEKTTHAVLTLHELVAAVQQASTAIERSVVRKVLAEMVTTTCNATADSSSAPVETLIAVPILLLEKGHWSSSEHNLFLAGIECYRKEWKKVATHVTTCTVTQVRAHAKSHFKLPKTAAPVVIPPTDGMTAPTPIATVRPDVTTPDGIVGVVIRNNVLGSSEPVFVLNFDRSLPVCAVVSVLKETSVYKSMGYSLLSDDCIRLLCCDMWENALSKQRGYVNCCLVSRKTQISSKHHLLVKLDRTLCDDFLTKFSGNGRRLNVAYDLWRCCLWELCHEFIKIGRKLDYSDKNNCSISDLIHSVMVQDIVGLVEPVSLNLQQSIYYVAGWTLCAAKKMSCRQKAHFGKFVLEFVEYCSFSSDDQAT